MSPPLDVKQPQTQDTKQPQIQDTMPSDDPHQRLTLDKRDITFAGSRYNRNLFWCIVVAAIVLLLVWLLLSHLTGSCKAPPPLS